MKILKRILLVIAALIALLLIIGLFTKKEYSVEREITIARPKQQVFDYVKYIKNQDHYSKWVMMDPNVRSTYKGTDGTVGFIAAWESDRDDVGKGEQEIKAIKEGERTDVEVRFIEPFEGRADTYTTMQAIGQDQTQVKWYFHTKMKYPLNLMMVFVDFPGMIGKDMDTTLTNLKNVLEKQ